MTGCAVAGGAVATGAPALLLAVQIYRVGDDDLRLIDTAAAREVAAPALGAFVLRSLGDDAVLWWDNTAELARTGPRVNAVSDPLGQRRTPVPGVPNGCVDLSPLWTRTHLVSLCSGTGESLVRVATARLDGTTDTLFDLPAPVGATERRVAAWQQGVELVDRGAGFAAGAAGAAMVLDRAHDTLLGLG